MYSVGGWRNLLAPTRLRALQEGVPRNVFLLGLTSLFTDISSEMVVSVLPIHLVAFLRLTPVQFGLIDGLYHGVAAVMQLASGIVSDRWQRQKEVAAIGYTSSALSRLGLLMTTAWTGIAGILVVDRLGQGLRTAPRAPRCLDLSQRSQRSARNGVWHPSGDGCDGRHARTCSGVRTPHVCPSSIRRRIRDELSGLSDWIGGAPAVCREPADRTPHARHDEWLLFASSLGADKEPGLSTPGVLCTGSRPDDDEGFVYVLALQRQMHFAVGSFPLLYVLTSLGYLVLAVPAGLLADRITAECVLCRDGRSLMALAGGMLSDMFRTTGLAVLTTATAVARLGASLIFGLAWFRLGLRPAVSMFLVGLVIAVGLAVATRPRAEPSQAPTLGR